MILPVRSAFVPGGKVVLCPNFVGEARGPVGVAVAEKAPGVVEGRFKAAEVVAWLNQTWGAQ